MTNVITIDIECTISNKGNPFDQTNKLIRAGFLPYKGIPIITEGEYMPSIQAMLNKAKWFIGFNIKFDLHWLRRVGYTIPPHIRIFDCQIAHFLLVNQTERFPSLDDALTMAGIPLKIDKVKKYWDEEIDTDKIPLDVLDEYLVGDLEKTSALAVWQREQLKDQGKYPLFQLHCEDLLVLEEMEYNGIKFNVEASLKEASVIEGEMNELLAKIYDYIGFSNFNISSNDHLSAVLYGGLIKNTVRIPNGVYKSGDKKGQTRYRLEEHVVELPRRFTPLPKSEAKKEGYWYVNNDILPLLKPLNRKDKVLIELIQKYNKLNKLVSTYLTGWPKFIEEKNWEKNTLHGNLNQCTVITGRLSSTQPNQQNADPITKKFIYSRYENI